MILVCKGRFNNDSHKADIYILIKIWNFLSLNYGDDKLTNVNISKPENFNEMLEIAKKLSEDFVFARIDLYNIKGKIYFGEITLSPNSGFDPDITEETDLMFGEKLDIPYWENIKR